MHLCLKIYLHRMHVLVEQLTGDGRYLQCISRSPRTQILTRTTTHSPGKQFMMTAFMMWMMGSGVHIMNIIFTFYQVYLCAHVSAFVSVSRRLLIATHADSLHLPLRWTRNGTTSTYANYYSVSSRALCLCVSACLRVCSRNRLWGPCKGCLR